MYYSDKQFICLSKTILLCFLFLFLNACHNKGVVIYNAPTSSKDSLDKMFDSIAFVSPPKPFMKYDTTTGMHTMTETGIDISDGSNLFSIIDDFFRSKGETEKEWWSLYSDCIKSELLRKSEAHYFGLSTPYGLGSILTKDKKGEWNGAKILSLDAQKLCFSDAGAAACQQTATFKVNIQTFINANITSGINAQLDNAIASTKEVTAKINSWKLMSLDIGAFKKIIDTATTGSIVDARSDIAQNPGYLITTVAEVDGFSTQISLTDTIRDTLKVMLSQQGGFKPNGNANISFGYIDNKTIGVTSLAPFYVFVSYSLIKMTPK